jgi:hypothetical protein
MWDSVGLVSAVIPRVLASNASNLLFVFLFLVVVPALFVIVLFVVSVISRQDTRNLYFRGLAKIIAVYAHGNTPPLRFEYTPPSIIRLRPSLEDIIGSEVPMNFDAFSFGSIRIDGVTYEHDVIIDRGAVRKRKKKPSKQFREEFGHTPLSVAEEIPWDCKRLVIGTGGGALPVMDQVKHEAEQRKIKLSILPTADAIKELKRHPRDTNAILHVTC